MAATLELQVLATPVHMEQQLTKDTEKHINMSEGGLYTTAQLEDFNRLVTTNKNYSETSQKQLEHPSQKTLYQSLI